MLLKYPRTPHLQGSRLQPGDADLAAVAFPEIAGRYLVLEEKLDGANSAISFDTDGALRLQSRGHYLTGGPRERQFGPMKAWAAGVRSARRCASFIGTGIAHRSAHRPGRADRSGRTVDLSHRLLAGSLVDRWETPDPTEAHQVEWVSTAR
jgi:hypothetical protein